MALYTGLTLATKKTVKVIPKTRAVVTSSVRKMSIAEIKHISPINELAVIDT